jgi:hypothetical protein
MKIFMGKRLRVVDIDGLESGSSILDQSGSKQKAVKSVLQSRSRIILVESELYRLTALTAPSSSQAFNIQYCTLKKIFKLTLT